MSDHREFSVYRYPRALWPRVLGRAPFFAEGPECRRLMPSLRWAVREAYGEGDESDREGIAEYLLAGGLVVPLWASSQRDCVPEGSRREIEIRELAKELGPIPWESHTGLRWDLAEATWEYLDSLATVEMRRRYVSEDGIVLG